MAQEDSTRRLGIPSASALVIANMVGAGVFTTSGFSLEALGSREYVLLAWLVGGVIALCGAISYGALARRFTESGGEYLFLSKVFHPLAGFLAGWVSLLFGFTAPIAVAALSLQAYVEFTFAPGIRSEWIGTVAIATAGIIHALRFREGVWLQNGAVILKLVLIFAFIAFGLSSLPETTATVVEPVKFAWGAFAVTLVYISFSYSGWNAAVYIAGEVRDPERNLPRSLLLGAGIVTVLYLGLNAVFLYSVPIAELKGQAEVGAIAARALGGQGLERGVSLLIGLAQFTSIWAMVMAGPRVYAKMAEDGLFPQMFRASEDTPIAAITVQAGAAIVLLWLSELEALFRYIGFTLGISASLTVVGLILLRTREGAERVPVWGYPVVPVAFIAATLWAASYLITDFPREAAIGVGTALLGVPVYFLIKRPKQA